ALRHAPAVRGDVHADQQARRLPGAWRQRRFVEIVDVEVAQPVVALVRTEILEVQIAADPGHWRAVEFAAAAPVLEKQVASTAQEEKRVLREAGIFAREQLRIALCVEFQDTLVDLHPDPLHNAAQDMTNVYFVL